MCPTSAQARSELNDTVVDLEMGKLVAQMGPANEYHRLGISGILPAEPMLLRNCRLARKHALSVGYIIGSQSHTRPDLWNAFDADLRNYQWRQDGVTWQGLFVNTSANATDATHAVDMRDDRVPTLSRLAAGVRAPFIKEAAAQAAYVKSALEGDCKDVLVVINGVIEEELATAAAHNISRPHGMLGDYSPFAVAEFRDWLRHTGIYGTSGTHAGQGAPATVVGPLVRGVSPFHFDPTPSASAHPGGASFNTRFGTNFTTWSLRSWDLDLFPEPLPLNATLTPAAGERGHTAGGFDAPRSVDPASRWWNAFSWDLDAHAGAYPPGNPAAPAFGFRQQLVKHWVEDIFAVLIMAGLPRDMMFPHQIPGDILGSGESEDESRCLSSASPVWTGLLEASGNVGITRFGPINTSLITQYLPEHTNGWGIFEWHPAPNAAPESQALYDASKAALQDYYNHGAHVLFPGWWGFHGVVNTIFPLNDSRFADAIKDFLKAAPSSPWSPPSFASAQPDDKPQRPSAEENMATKKQ